MGQNMDLILQSQSAAVVLVTTTIASLIQPIPPPHRRGINLRTTMSPCKAIYTVP